MAILTISPVFVFGYVFYVKEHEKVYGKYEFWIIL